MSYSSRVHWSWEREWAMEQPALPAAISLMCSQVEVKTVSGNIVTSEMREVLQVQMETLFCVGSNWGYLTTFMTAEETSPLFN